MTPGDAIQAEANREDGWPYPDNDADIREDRRADLEEPLPEELEGLFITDLDEWGEEFIDTTTGFEF